MVLAYEGASDAMTVELVLGLSEALDNPSPLSKDSVTIVQLVKCPE